MITIGETSGLCAEKLLPIVWDIEENGDAICEEIEEIEVNDREEGTEQDTTTHDNDNVTEITESGPSGDTKCKYTDNHGQHRYAHVY